MRHGFNGFGDFWKGTDDIHALTTCPAQLRIDLTAADGDTAYAYYQSFKVNEFPNYTVEISGFCGTVPQDDFGSESNGMGFISSSSCSDHSSTESFWWFSDCSHCNLNGYQSQSGTPGAMFWQSFKGYTSLSQTSMKILTTDQC